jgi:TonB-dependent SusC/RagA subfamily outer membrane receptor
MKYITLISTIVLLMALQACSSSDAIRDDSSADESEERISNQIRNTGESDLRELSDYLVRISGVTVSGSGSSTQVRVRGTSSFIGGNEPLFVLDGRIMGQSYNSVSFISVNDIESVRVLKGGDAAAYGARGANGVIEIITRKEL